MKMLIQHSANRQKHAFMLVAMLMHGIQTLIDRVDRGTVIAFVTAYQ